METGKIRQALYEWCISAPDAQNECDVCLTIGQVRWILSQTDYAGWSTRWYTLNGSDIEGDTIQAMRDDLIERLFMTCCGDIQTIERRLNPDTGTAEISTDGGMTWKPDPDDPRNSGVALPPPVTSGAAADKCAAANSVTKQLQIYVDDILNSKANTLGLIDFCLAIAAIALAILVAPAWALFPALIMPLIQKIFLASASELIAAMSGGTYDTFTCIIFCNMNDDGSMTEGQWTQAIQNMAEQIGDPLAYNTCRAFMLIYGVLGVNNAASQGINYGYDCDTCNCTGCFENWLAANLTPQEPTTGTDANGDYLQWTATNTGIDYRVEVSNDGNWPSLNYSNNCCVPGGTRFATFLTGTETPAVTSTYGFACGDNDLGHYGALTNVPWWGAEIIGTLEQGAFDVRLYL